jgi:predicted phage-related endonuclease
MKILKIPGDINALVDELRGVRERKKADEKREDQIVTKLKEVSGQEPATLYFDKNIVAMIEQATATRIDAAKLRANHPDIAAECSVTGTYLKVKVY